jgi:cytochrome c553
MRKPALILALFSIMLPGPIMADGDPETGKVKAYTCTGCHGIPGYKNTYPMYKVPRIGGQNFAYLVAALSAYQNGERLHPTMNLQAESLSRQDIDDIATWLSGLESKAVPLAGSSAPGPDSTQACQACHGTDGLGTNNAYPALAGQYRSYTVRVLTDYRDGKRKNAIMGGFAKNLSDQDINDLANWYSGLNGLRDLSEQ